MKKLLYLFLTLLIVACSSEDGVLMTPITDGNNNNYLVGVFSVTNTLYDSASLSFLLYLFKTLNTLGL